MLITYKKFKDLVPKETLDFVNKSLPMIDYFMENGKIESKWGEINYEYAMLVIIFSYALHIMGNSSLLFEYGFDPSQTTVLEYQIPIKSPELCFKEYGHYFCIFDELYKYQCLTPYMILYEQYSNVKFTSDSKTPELFGGLDNMRALFKMLQKMNEEEMIIKENSSFDFNNLPIETIDYLEKASQMHQLLGKNNNNRTFDDKDIEVLSLFLVSLLENSDNRNLSNISAFWEYNGISLSAIEEILVYKEFTAKINEYKKNYLIINYHYKKYIEYLKNDKSFDEKDIRICDILGVLNSREINKSVQIERLLLVLDKPIDIFDNLGVRITAFSIHYQKEVEKNFINSFPDEIKKYLEDVSRVHTLILESKNRNKTILEEEKDIKELAMIIVLLHYKAPLSYFLEKNGLTLENIFKSGNLDENLLKKLEITPVNNKCIYEKYQNYLQFPDKDNVSLVDITKNMFNNNINDSLAIEKIVVNSGHGYQILKEEIETEKDHIEEISLENRITLLENTLVPNITLDNLKSILNFGSDLSIHSQYIHTELPKMALNDKTEEATTTLSNVISKFYKKPEKSSFFQRFLLGGKKEKPENNQVLNLDLNQEDIQELVTLINQNINILENEIMGYDLMQKYLGVYLRKNESFSLVLQKAILEAEKDINDDTHEVSFETNLERTSKFKIMSDKLERFHTSILIIKQELVKINQSIINHFVTINALQTAKDDLIPIIQMELAMNVGKDSENRSLELSESVVLLFQSLLTRNMEKSLVNMEKLENSLLDQRTLLKIQKDVKIYFDELQNMQNIDASSPTINAEIPDSNDPKRMLIK